MHLNLEKLTVSQKLFEPFGDVISKGMENNKFLINQGYCERFDEVATVQVLDKKAIQSFQYFLLLLEKDR